jgi:hypothetical protein
MTEWTPNIFPTLTIDSLVVSEWEKLKEKIVRYYNHHEICVETPDYFIFIFNREIENNYKIWEMKTIAFKHDFEIYSNRLTNVVNQSEQDMTQNSTSSNTENIGVDGKGNVTDINVLPFSEYQNSNYSTQQTFNKGKNTSSGNQAITGNSRGNNTISMTGKDKTDIELYKIYSQNLENIDLEFIRNLRSCFLCIY